MGQMLYSVRSPSMNYMSKAKQQKPLWGRRVAARRAELGKSLTDIDNETNGVVYQALLYRLENGKKDPSSLKVNQIEALLLALDWTPAEYAAETELDLPMPDPVKDLGAIAVKSIRIPVVDAGAGLPAWNGETGEWLTLDLPALRSFNRNDLFVVRVWGDSMTPTLLGGDLGVFARHEQVSHNSIVAVTLDDGLVVKRLLRENGQIWLASDNRQYAPSRMHREQKVYGVFKALVRMY